MACDLSNIECSPGPNFGSIKAIHIIRSKYVLAVPACSCADNHLITGPISIPVGQGFISYYFKPNTLSYKFTERQTPNGPVFDCELQAGMDKIRPAVDAEIRKLSGGHFVLVSEDFNGNVRLHGSPENPWVCLTSGNTGETKGAQNGYSWKFKGTEKHPSCYMDPLQPIPHKEELTEPLIIEIGSNDAAGNFIKDEAAEIYDQTFLYMRISGQVYEADGITPAAPAVGNEIELTFSEKDTAGLSTPIGVVRFDWVNPIIWGDPVPANNSSPSSDPASSWGRYEGDILAGSGIDAAGVFTLNFNKASWASVSHSYEYDDAKEIVIEARVIKSGVVSAPSYSLFGFINVYVDPVAMREFMLAVVDTDTLEITSLEAVSDQWSIIGDWDWEIGDNVFSIASGGSYSNSSPIAGSAGISDITSTRHDTIEVTYSNTNSPWLHKVRISLLVQHVTGLQKTVYFETWLGTLDLSTGKAFIPLISPGWAIGAYTRGSYQANVLLAFDTEKTDSGFTEALNKRVLHDGRQVGSNLPEASSMNFIYFLNKRKTIEEGVAYADLQHSSLAPGVTEQASRNIFLKQRVF